MTLRMNGSTSGYVELDCQATGGNNNIKLPASNGSANNLLKNSGTAGTLEFASNVFIDSSSRLLIGTSSARANFFNASNTAGLQIEAANDAFAANRFASITYGDNLANAPIFIFAKHRGTSLGATTVVNSGDQLGRISFQGADGTEFVPAVDIKAEVDGTPGANDMPGRLVFSTTADGAASPTEAMRIERSGGLLVPAVYTQTTAGAANINVFSNGQIRRSTSSSKYKTNIETLENSYADAILNVRPVWYRSTCDGDNPKHGWWGFIAEEVAAIDPRLVHWKTIEVTFDKKGSAVQTPCDPEPEGVAYDRFVPHLLNLIKRQREQIEAMEARLSALEAS